MLIRLKLILVIYKCMFYVNYSRFIVAHFMTLRCGRLTLYILKMYAYVYMWLSFSWSTLSGTGKLHAEEKFVTPM